MDLRNSSLSASACISTSESSDSNRRERSNKLHGMSRLVFVMHFQA